MPDTKHIKILVLSDLHCQDGRSDGKNDSLFSVGQLRRPSSQHPVQALIELASQQDLSCDALVVPGDLTNKISPAGLAFSWYAIKEIAQKLPAKQIIVTLGNHDIDSRHTHSGDPFHIAKNISPDFPLFEQRLNAQFWSTGFAFVDAGEDVQFLVINSAIDHHDEESAIRGTFDERRLEDLSQALKTNVRKMFNIAVLHHHPVLHSLPIFEQKDVLPTGDRLLEILSQHGFEFVVHGHRHHPAISTIGTGRSLTVFGAGTFSALLREMSTYTRNLVHHITLEKSDLNSSLKGWINTWEFNLGSGWQRATHRSANLPYHAGFGVQDARIIAKAISRVVKGAAPLRFVWNTQIIDEVPDIFYLTPQQMRDVVDALNVEYGLRVAFNDDGSLEGVGYASR